MKKIIFLCVLLAPPLMCMDDDDNDTVVTETPTKPREKLQLNYANKKITAEQFKNHIQKSPNLIAYNAEGHVMRKVPDQLPTLFLQQINLNNGLLEDNATLPTLLTLCPHLRYCSLAHNQLETVCEATIPYHHKLLNLDCSNNQIKYIDFTQLLAKLPKLMNLNLSHNPLTNCNIDDMLPAEIITTINLRGTQFSDSVKKDILKNAQIVNHRNNGVALFGGMIFGILGSIPIGIPLVIATLSPYAVFVPVGCSTLLIGPAIGYFCSLCCVDPAEREIVLYSPIFDSQLYYTEAETTTRYQRFIRHFPYFCNLFKQCCNNAKTSFEKVGDEDVTIELQ